MTNVLLCLFIFVKLCLGDFELAAETLCILVRDRRA